MTKALIALWGVIAWSLIFSPVMAAAPDQLPTIGWTHAISMHGVPALGPEAAHLPYADPAAPRDGTLRIGEVGSFDTLNPFTLKGTALGNPDFIIDRLTAQSWDEPFTLYGLIAQKIWLAPDRKSIIFAIHPQARFNDGSPITVADIAASFDILKAKGRPNMRKVYALVSNVRIYDDRHIGFVFNKNADRETPMIIAKMPVFSKKDLASRAFDTTTLTPLLTSGPYEVSIVEPGRRIVFMHRSNYWALSHPMRVGLYNPDRIDVRYFRDAIVALEAFKKGDVDIKIERDPAKWAQHYEPRGYVKKEITHHRPDRVRAIIFNTRRAPLDDVRVRRALRLAFDQEAVMRSQGYGLLRPTTSLFANTDLAASHNKAGATDTRTRLKAANDLLSQAGYRVTKGKRDIQLTLILNEARDEKTALLWQKALERLGIILRVKTLDTVQFAGALAQFDYDLVLHGWVNSLSPGSEQAVYWGCGAAQSKGSFNYAGICDVHIETLLPQIAAAKDRDSLRRVVQDLDTRLWELAPAIYLPHMAADFLAYWPQKIDPGPQSALYGFALETVAVKP